MGGLPAPRPRGLEGWAVAAVVLPFLIGFPAIVAALVAFGNLDDHPFRRGRRLAWAGATLSCLQLLVLATAVAYFVYRM